MQNPNLAAPWAARLPIAFFSALFCMCIGANKATAQDNLVDLFSGDFRYEVPLLLVPSADGPGVPLALQYRSGIQVNQKAGWVGLGWDLNVGEIRRDVNGVPDDWKDVTQKTRIYQRNAGAYTLTKEYLSRQYGPLYYKDFGNWSAASPEREMDVYVSSGSSATFAYPNYDNYQVTVPGIQGSIRPFLFEKGTLVSKDIYPAAGQSAYQPTYFDAPGHERNESVVSTNNFGTAINAPGTFQALNICKTFTKSPQFLFESEFGTVNANPESGVFSGNLHSGGATAKCTRNIVYYTGYQYRTNTQLADLIKYPGFTSDPGKDNDLVAFRITDEAGFTYHFSLPVYVLSHQAINMEMPDFVAPTANGLNITVATKVNAAGTIGKPYVAVWKLTAITGPDFKDNAPLNAIGAEDEGYWVQFDYAQWSPAFAWQTPYYDAAHHFGENEEWQRQLQEKYPNTWQLWAGFSFPDFSDEGNISKGTTELYYLDKIRTRTHTAFLVKDVRLDEYSKVYTGPSVSGSTPNLYLRRVILLNAADAALFSSSAAMTNPKPANFTINSTLAAGLTHEQKYQAVKATVDPKTVAAVELNYDYFLTPNYYNNINAYPGGGYSIATTSFSFPAGYTDDNFIFEKYTAGATPSGQSGKLTLKNVKFLGLANAQALPSTDFTYAYAQTASPKNYAFHPFKKDFWGYYKDFSSATPYSHYAEYQTPTSKNQVDAWSLTRIRTPLGAFLDVEYESDEYEEVGRDGSPVRIFGGSYTGISGNMSSGYFDFDDVSLYELLNSYASDIKQVTLGYPLNCSYTATYYSAPLDASFQWAVANHEGMRKAFYQSPASIGGIYKTILNNKTRLGSTGSPINLSVNCGSGPAEGLTATPNNEKILASTASVQLTKAYGGGTRVKSIAVKELDSSTGSTLLSYKTEFAYANGVASLEPDRFTPSFLNGRSKLNYLYDPHSFAPKVGYSTVTIQGKKANLTTPDIPTENTDNTTVFEFANYNDAPFYNNGQATGVHDNTLMDVKTSYDAYFDCVKTNGNNPQALACQSHLTALAGIGHVFNLYSLNQNKGYIAKNRERTQVGKLLRRTVKDRNGILLEASENVFDRKNSLSEVFHERFHTVTPVVYDPNFLYQTGAIVANNVVLNGVFIGGFSPFNSPNAKGRATVLHTNLYFQKHMENEFLKKQVVTQNDIPSVTEYLEFDPITGYPTRTRTLDPSTGAVLEKQTEYAYTQAAYATMGPKSADNTYTNQLARVHLSKTLKNNVLVDGQRSTYDKNLTTRQYNTTTAAYESVLLSNKSWKPKKVFAFNGNTDPLNWKEVTEITLFSPRGAVLEARDLATSANGSTIYRYNSIKLGYNDQYAVTQVSDARYTEATFCGAEDLNAATGYFGGEVKLGQSASVNTSSATVHSGTKSLLLSPSGSGFEYRIPATELDPTRGYMVRVWVHTNGLLNAAAGLKYQFLNSNGTVAGEDVVYYATSTGFTANNNGYTYAKADGWVLLSLKLVLPVGLSGRTLVLKCVNNHATASAWFDDFRFQPLHADMTNYLYDTQAGLVTYTIDKDNFYQKIEYDAMGRVKKVSQETLQGLKTVAETNLNYYRISAPTLQY
ncbi:MAG: hypothetical protein IT260_23645 [Saprospiraceae bacterium]|nr:hypothetical protein [Saprospiraceae bacterium]